ncbi:aldehyde dehydrogenase family protein [Bacillus sp. Marseille-P3661]|uniref:aldehyde dehydrogenase family protein n=1 Tax=Bacillus sp. Marseille-P3661 TaxID=1936234 RepID=UPI000C83E40D|nr:aldehyde dehydrogenase family protein [Bacillus sp. Marseille-P3661]
MKVNLFIDNKEVKSDLYQEVKDPGRLDVVVGEVAQGTVDHVNQAVQAAQKAFRSWKKSTVEKRIALLNQAADMLEKESNSLAKIVSSENGMLLNTTKGEMVIAAAALRNIAGFAEPFFQPKQIEDGNSWVSVERKPLGVIAAIVPWNAPMVLTMQKLAPALVCGNTIVFKPSPFAPMGVSVALQKIATLFPPGVINVIHGDGRVGAALTTHPLVRKISFTGGGPTAKHVMKAAADSLKAVQFELGGNDPAILLDDVDVDEVVPQLVSGVFRRSGQYCFAVKRIYIPKNLYNEVYEKMVILTSQFKIGHQLNEETTFGPLNNKQQYEFIKGMIERLKESGVTVTELGEKVEPENWNNGYYLHPIIVRDLPADHELVTSEQFGPIIPLVPYETEEDVIEMANNTEYGLGSSVWSKDFERALKISRELEVGLTFINGVGQSPLGSKHMPFGGVKQSGIGRENSEAVLEEYTSYHAINYHKR